MTGAWLDEGESARRRAENPAFARWLGLGFVLHAALALGGGRLSLLSEMARLVQELRRAQHALFAVPIEIPVEPPAPPPAPPVVEAPPAAPPPAPEIAKAPPPPAREAPPPAEAPSARLDRFFSSAADAVAQAAKILTRDDEAPGGETIASGDAAGPSYGLVAGAGTGTAPTWNPHAAIGGTPGGTGLGLGPPQAPAPDRSRGAHVYGGFTDDCDFPPEADVARIDHATATVVVTVRPDGAPELVEVVDDPGHGFGRAARACALKLRYLPARDREGTLLRAKTPPVTIRFTR